MKWTRNPGHRLSSRRKRNYFLQVHQGFAPFPKTCPTVWTHLCKKTNKMRLIATGFFFKFVYKPEILYVDASESCLNKEICSISGQIADKTKPWLFFSLIADTGLHFRLHMLKLLCTYEIIRKTSIVVIKLTLIRFYKYNRWFKLNIPIKAVPMFKRYLLDHCQIS